MDAESPDQPRRPPAPTDTTVRVRLRLRLRGAVQGVGFRPFVYRLARSLRLGGFVLNDSGGVSIEVEGESEDAAAFAVRLLDEAPPRSSPEVVGREWLAPLAEQEFTIRSSPSAGARRAVILADIATCSDCLRELADVNDRRHRYAFTNCTHCGPRFSIILGVPYDRPRTTMAGFTQCAACRREYTDPLDRRFHAQPNACPSCGPALRLLAPDGRELAARDDALTVAVSCVERGEILALQGLGGFHLITDATNATAVRRLRERKQRWEKPLALMVPDLSWVRKLCQTTPLAEAVLSGPEAPIVLLGRGEPGIVAEEVAPQNPRLGVMLPYTPLHHLLVSALARPLVATSGNLSDEPICISPEEALARLAGIADHLLVHDRPIARQVDDSVVSLVNDGVQLVRRSRGYAPTPLRLPEPGPCVLALGPHLKNTIALLIGDEIVVSQHIGDLETPEALDAHRRIIQDFLEMYDVEPRAVAHDLHPDYASTRLAVELVAGAERPGAPGWQRRLSHARVIGVQHHHAHLAACLADAGAHGPALGVTWDGTGFGPDGTTWGGEFLFGDAREFSRVAHLRPFRLPGGDAAAREPRRAALALLWELMSPSARTASAWPAGSATLEAFSASELAVMRRVLERGINAPWTSSAGRLFDAFASLLGVNQRAAFEGQAAIQLEHAAGDVVLPGHALPLVERGSALEVDWGPAVHATLEARARGEATAALAARFHATLAQSICAVARRTGATRVALTGGCFQNRWLSEMTTRLLRDASIDVLVHSDLPPNDACVSAGQALVAAAALVGVRSESE